MRYNTIIYNDICNGYGTRISYFCQGCSIHCEGCHNTSLQDFNGGREFTKEILDESLAVFDLFKNYYDGITLIGGECMDNLDFGIFVASEFKRRFPNKTIWIYSGYTFEEIIEDKNKIKLLKFCDVLIDGRFIKKLKDTTLRFRGSSNQDLVDIQQSLIMCKKVRIDK
jgi:anaerobic ribonucleoside-triphosphate reductase activating protein